MARIVIVGGSFGGLTTALQLKQKLKKQHHITLLVLPRGSAVLAQLMR
ncbi:hypothetical protein SAMN05660649_02655 [Desulfotomaculum arcticum]|uniref:Pyridine nucleotide-disulphide oxidoreductase n=1 Tax=Desulfotruncus arcticus DSM 17038 TaxID=1121424 RepID=A0A1I2UJA9_9FIRM|nr:hypothetical protein [Desulfotruncus arcticus]SFG77215.1 hypothetical protein SAMN05660649_02655 [Desulfotomaculum arcticum] [Desulfotruncus arcticus DSM 17038]